MATSPTARSLALLRDRGFTAQVVEHFNVFAKQRFDLFGCIDIVAMGNGCITGVQCTTGDHLAERVAKILAEPRMRLWLECGGYLQAWGWSKTCSDGRGSRKLWTVRVREITLHDWADVTVTELAP